MSVLKAFQGCSVETDGVQLLRTKLLGTGRRACTIHMKSPCFLVAIHYIYIYMCQFNSWTGESSLGVVMFQGENAGKRGHRDTFPAGQFCTQRRFHS